VAFAFQLRQMTGPLSTFAAVPTNNEFCRRGRNHLKDNQPGPEF
jgi:hypothetical protein